MIVPHCGIKSKINHRFPTDMLERNVFIANQQIPWPKPADRPRRAFINNFSATSGNTALLIEDAPPEIQKLGEEPRTSFPVIVSAESPTALRKHAEILVQFLAVNSQTPLPALSYTTGARRAHYITVLLFLARASLRFSLDFNRHWIVGMTLYGQNRRLR